MVSADKSQSIIFLIRTFTYKRKKGRTFRRGQQLQWGPNEMHHKGTEWDLGSGTQLYLSHLPLAGLHGIFHSMDGCQSSWVGKFSQDMRMCTYRSHWAKFCQYPQTFESQCSDPFCSLMSISELTPTREWEQDMIYWTNQTSKQIKEITVDIQ